MGVQASCFLQEQVWSGSPSRLFGDVRKCGYHSKVVFRTDGEPAILDLMGEVPDPGEFPTVLAHVPNTVGVTSQNGSEAGFARV